MSDCITFDIVTDPEFAELIPPSTEPELDGLEEAILRDGCTDPLIVWKGRDILVDGHNRKRICDKYGIAYRTCELEFASRNEAKCWIIGRQFGRRNLSPYQRAELALRLKPMLTEEARKRMLAGKADPVEDLPQGSDNSPGSEQLSVEENAPPVLSKTRDVLAARAGISGRTIDKADYITEHADEATKQKLRNGKSSIDAEYKRIRQAAQQAERQARKQRVVDIPDADKIRLEVCEVAEAAARIEPGSVDFVITDPPYPEKYLPLFAQLADFAGSALKPGGSLICMSGQSYLPEVFRLLNENGDLNYHWTLAYLTPGGQATQLWERKVNTFWKPLLWFVKEKYQNDWIGDVVRSAANDNDKSHHHWGQSVSGMHDLLNRFVLPGQVVCDPFLGGGTTAIAARQCNCRFIGFDVDEECLNTTRARLAQTTQEDAI